VAPSRAHSRLHLLVGLVGVLLVKWRDAVVKQRHAGTAVERDDVRDEQRTDQTQQDLQHKTPPTPLTGNTKPFQRKEYLKHYSYLTSNWYRHLANNV